MVQNSLDILVNSILESPLWVQEVVFVNIKKRLEDLLKGVTSSNEDEIYPIYVPELTFLGKKELETHFHKLDMNLYKYLFCVSQNQRVIDITLNNFWTLEESSKYLAELIKSEYVKTPKNRILTASIYYLAGEIRLVEYIKQIDMINIEQLDDVIRKQKNHNESNPSDKKKIGEILLSMGYVANKDIDKILHIKNEAKKRFLVTSLNTPAKVQQAGAQPSAKEIELQQTIEKLTKENNLLKGKLRAVFNIQNKKQQ